MLTEKSHLCYPQWLTRLHLSSQKEVEPSPARQIEHFDVVTKSSHCFQFQIFTDLYYNVKKVEKVANF